MDISDSPTTLGAYLTEVLAAFGMSANQLALAAGVAQSTISTLLRQGEDPKLPGPHPLVLRAVCQALLLDYVYVFKLAGYIPHNYQPPLLAKAESILRDELRELSLDQQMAVMEFARSLRQPKISDLSGTVIRKLVEKVRALQRAHALFRPRRVNRPIEMVQYNAERMGQTAENALLNAITDRLNKLFEPREMSREHIQAVIHNPQVRVVLNILLPRKDITQAEKLYWICQPPDKESHEPLSPEEEEAVKSLWELVADIANADSG